MLLPFDSQDAEFARGFEAGRLWALTESRDEVRETVSVRNAEMMMRIAEARGRVVRSELDDEWLELPGPCRGHGPNSEDRHRDGR